VHTKAISSKASEIVRQLSLAGVALIWIFKSGDVQALNLVPSLRRAALFIFAALFLDFLQYLIGTFVWFVVFRRAEIGGTKWKQEFEVPLWLNWPTWTLFSLKSFSLLVAYLFFILPFLIGKFNH